LDLFFFVEDFIWNKHGGLVINTPSKSNSMNVSTILIFSDKIWFQNLQVSICLHLVELNNQPSPNPLHNKQHLHLYDMLTETLDSKNWEEDGMAGSMNDMLRECLPPDSKSSEIWIGNKIPINLVIF
jgi:hypothetical protein